MRVPDIEKVRLAYEYRRIHPGWSVRDIAALVGAGHSTVANWFAREDAYHPDIDEVAVARALGGDQAVWNRLTVFEEQAFIGRLAALRASMTAPEWSEYLEELTRRLAGSEEGRQRMVNRLSTAVTRAAA